MNKTESTESHIELAKIALKNKQFEFNDSFRKQKESTDMGTKFAPAYAIFFIATLKDEILESFFKIPQPWWRYVDDIFMTWYHKKNEFKQFIDKLNKFHPAIKFT